MSVVAASAASEGSAETVAAPCPSCGEGHLLPMTAASFYVCTTPGCTYTISASGTAVTYYKGHANTETKEKGGKRWVEFSF